MSAASEETGHWLVGTPAAALQHLAAGSLADARAAVEAVMQQHVRPTFTTEWRSAEWGLHMFGVCDRTGRLRAFATLSVAPATDLPSFIR